jgi:putative YjhG/YagF family dehydratase
MTSDLYAVQTRAPGPSGSLPLTESMLRELPSGDLFGLTQNVGMGWSPAQAAAPQYLVLSTHGGIRAPDGTPIALGYHTGHWEVGLLVEAAAREITARGAVPFAAYCSDPCDGRTQGTPGMMDSLAYRNDAATVFGRLIRSLPRRCGVMGVATCDKGLPAMLMALAGAHDLPCVLVPGGVTLPPEDGEDAGAVQTIGVRYAHGLLTLEEAAQLGCRACASPGGGCQFLGTAASAQVAAEALGLTVQHAALAPSGQPIWLDAARRSAHALLTLWAQGITTRQIVTHRAVQNAMIVHAACGGSTNMLLHLPAVAHAAGLPRPTVSDWVAASRATPRIVDVLPNGPRNHPTIQFFLAGGVPEVMLHLRRMGLLHTDCLTAEGISLDAALDAWESSERRRALRQRLREADGVDPDDVILTPDRARAAGLTGTVCFPSGNLAPEGSVIKSTAIDPSVVDADNVYRKTGPVRVFITERDAIAAIKASTGGARARRSAKTRSAVVRPGDILVLICRGPLGAGMEEIYQVTSALKHLPWGKEVAVLTDARFSGVSTGACIGHISPEALASGPIGKLHDGDIVSIVIDRNSLVGSIDLVGTNGVLLGSEWGDAELARRTPRPDLRPDPNLPEATRLWALLQRHSGGVWGGCVYDTEAIGRALG